MNYVVGFLGRDKTLGRTFVAVTYEQAKRSMYELQDENDDIFDIAVFDDRCVHSTNLGDYFIGQLEML